MKRHLLLKSLLLLCALVVGSTSVWGQATTIFSETFGDNGSSNTAYSSCTCFSASSSMFTTGTAASNYSGDGKVGKNNVNASTGYSGASGNSAVWRQAATGSNTVNFLVMDNINIAGYSNLSLSFGAFMTNGASSSNKIVVKYKIDNGTEQTMTVSGFPSSTSSWSLASGSISGTGNKLKLTFQHQTTGGYTYRLDDIKVTGVSSLASSAASFDNKNPSITYPATKTYSQAPTTADGYTGAITYTMTANTAGATIDAESGLVTVTKGGSVTVKATAAAVTDAFTSSEDSYTLTVNDSRAEAGLAWSAASADVTYGEDNDFPTLTNPNGVSVTYTSTNTDAATIDNNGVITLNDKTATTQIRAIFAGNDDYKDVTVSYTLNVTEGPFTKKDGVFDFVKASQQNPLEDYGSGVTLTNSAYTTGTKTWIAGNVTMVTNDGGGSGLRWWSADGTLRLYNKSTATFSVPSGYVITKIVTTGANFNSANVGSLSGSTWTGASNSVKLSVNDTRNIKTITITYSDNLTTEVQSYGWATYIAPAPVEFAANTAYVVTDASVSGGLTLASVTQVPKGTPVLLKGAGTKNITVIATATAPASNLLTVSDGTDLSSGEYPYVLAKDGDGACFKQWTGAMSALNGRVMLVLDENIAAARGIFELNDEATAIETVKAEKANNEYFNLAGQRVANPTKGLYIVNGKKVIIK